MIKSISFYIYIFAKFCEKNFFVEGGRNKSVNKRIKEEVLREI